MSETASIIADTTARIFADFAGNNEGAALWGALESAGLTRIWSDRESDGSLADGFAAVSASARFAAEVPLAETLLAGWLLAGAGVAVPPGVLTVAPARPAERIRLGPDGALRASARAVPFATQARHIVLACMVGQTAHVALVETAACRLDTVARFGGDAGARVVFDGVRPHALAPAAVDADALVMMGATMRSLQIAGALDAILAISIAYANERVAFERPLAKFQAVQHALARLAGETAAALSASASATDAMASLDCSDDGMFLEVAAAKIRCGEAAQEGAAIAHQVHGAIGYTREHPLHRFTQRMLVWRDDFGSESFWADALGARVAAHGADALWPLLASR